MIYMYKDHFLKPCLLALSNRRMDLKSIGSKRLNPGGILEAMHPLQFSKSCLGTNFSFAQQNPCLNTHQQCPLEVASVNCTGEGPPQQGGDEGEKKGAKDTP